MKKRTISVIALVCLLLVLPAMAMGKKPQKQSVTILYVDRDDSNSVVAAAEFVPEGPGSYTLDNDSPVVIQGLPEGYGLLEGNHYVITVSRDGRISPDTVRFKIKHVAVTPSPTPTAEPTATPVPTVEPTATPVPTVEPTATPVPTVEPTTTPVPTVEPTATPVPTVEPTATPVPTVEPTATPVPTVEPTATPVPTVEPTATPVPTVEPTATPVPTVEPTATPVPTVEPTATPSPSATPENGAMDYDPPKSGDASMVFTALSAIAAAAMFFKRK